MKPPKRISSTVTYTKYKKKKKEIYPRDRTAKIERKRVGKKEEEEDHDTL